MKFIASLLVKVLAVCFPLIFLAVGAVWKARKLRKQKLNKSRVQNS